MKKREWDKDFQSIKALVSKNKAPFMILGCLILILISYGFVSLLIRWVSDVNEVFSGNLSIENKFDFVTPALYYFSSIAQTMGAIIGLALAAMYAIMPNIRSSKDNPAFEPARRLLQRDEYFRRSINVGSVCILVSIVGLLFIYVTASSQSWAFILLLFLGVTALGLGVYSLGTMFYFIRVRMPKYFSPVEILEFAFEKNSDIVSNCSKESKLDFIELCLLSESNSITNRNTVRSFNIISTLGSSDIVLICETNIPVLLEKLKKDLLVSGITDDTLYLSKCFCSLINSTYKKYNTNLSKNPTQDDLIMSNIIERYLDAFALILIYTNNEACLYIFDYINHNLNININEFYSSFDLFLKIQYGCIERNQKILKNNYLKENYKHSNFENELFIDVIYESIYCKEFLNDIYFKDVKFSIYNDLLLILLSLISNNIRNLMQLYKNNILPSKDLISNLAILKIYVEDISKDRVIFTKEVCESIINAQIKNDYEFKCYTAFLLNLDPSYFYKFDGFGDPEKELKKLLMRIDYYHLHLIYSLLNNELNLKQFNGNLYSFIYDVFIPYLKPIINTDEYDYIFRKVLREHKSKK